MPEAGPDDASVSVQFEPSAVAEPVANVVHVHLPSSASSPGAVLLFEGALSSYYLGKFKHGEVPSALADRQWPQVSWRSAADLVIAPLRPLPLDLYSLVSVDGLLAEFTVGTVRPLLERFWPPANTAGSPQLAIYCRPLASMAEVPSSGSLRFEPGSFSVELAPGIDESGLFAERCSHFESEHVLAPGEIWVPPPVLGEWALSPAVFAPIESVAGEPSDVLGCGAGELALGPGCASVADDRLTVRTPRSVLLWIVHTARGALVQISAGGQPLIIDGLRPDALERLWGNTHELMGATREFEVELHTAPARERPILNEALADALGPEPQSEWVELLNDGTLAVDLGSYSLQDSGGRTPLPHVTLAPHEYALLVRDDFAPNGSDVPPGAGARLVRLPALGKSGLSNAGERLSLVDSAGVERSVLPALAGKPGQSLARLTPASADDDPKAFRFGTPTPGVANEAPAPAP
ncbi:MAG TPA: lamin tail domain-containing protein [Polyangiaceae bacterium]|nr:lamin tail domain-containing protein [Polyangiaceae bacterium]